MEIVQAQALLEVANRLSQMPDSVSQNLAGLQYDRIRRWTKEQPASTEIQTFASTLPRGYQNIPPY